MIASNVLVQRLTILAPIDSPNTDGIDPGSIIIHSLINRGFESDYTSVFVSS